MRHVAGEGRRHTLRHGHRDDVGRHDSGVGRVHARADEMPVTVIDEGVRGIRNQRSELGRRRIPLVDALTRAVLDPEGLVEEARLLGGSPAPAPAAVPPTLLVVDDSLTTRMLEQSILETAGYRVDLASSGEEGLAKARQGRYGLILVDVEMPGMSGFEFVEQLQADPALRDTPAILVSSRNAPEDLRRGRAAGAKDYMVKGEFDQARLLGRIRELLA